MSFQPFENLDVWKRACQQAVTIVKLTENFKNYSLKDQMTRCSISVPSNISEGHGRNGTKEFIRFLNIAQGSNCELRTQLYISAKIDLIETADLKKLIDENLEISKMIQGLRAKLQKSLP
ncbi:four helix bundle protein [Akkermansiaceae bacterium]|nr:four helix bundle protein [Akkermansiaceae bacterium]